MGPNIEWNLQSLSEDSLWVRGTSAYALRNVDFTELLRKLALPCRQQWAFWKQKDHHIVVSTTSSHQSMTLWHAQEQTNMAYQKQKPLVEIAHDEDQTSE